MTKTEGDTTARRLLAGIGIYHTVLGLAFGIAGAKFGLRLSPRLPMFVFMIGGARDFIVGAIVVFCAYRSQLGRAGLIAALGGFVLFAFIAASVSLFGHFTVWTGLRILGAILLVVLGIFARRAGRQQLT